MYFLCQLLVNFNPADFYMENPKWGEFGIGEGIGERSEKGLTQ